MIQISYASAMLSASLWL